MIPSFCQAGLSGRCRENCYVRIEIQNFFGGHPEIFAARFLSGNYLGRKRFYRKFFDRTGIGLETFFGRNNPSGFFSKTGLPEKSSGPKQSYREISLVNRIVRKLSGPGLAKQYLGIGKYPGNLDQKKLDGPEY
jgi:hypothetical protein